MNERIGTIRMNIRQLLNVWIDWVGPLSPSPSICVCKMHACMHVRYAITGYRVHILYYFISVDIYILLSSLSFKSAHALFGMASKWVVICASCAMLCYAVRMQRTPLCKLDIMFVCNFIVNVDTHARTRIYVLIMCICSATVSSSMDHACSLKWCCAIHQVVPHGWMTLIFSLRNDLIWFHFTG